MDFGTFDHTIAAFWYFVILSELLLALKKELEYQAGRRSEVFIQVHEINDALHQLEISASGDFTARINRLGSYVIQEIKARADKNEKLSPERLTNIVYRGGIADGKRLVVKYSAKIEHFIFLFDNIDKGWAAEGVDELDVRMVRLLVESLEKVKSDLGVENRDFIFVVFPRNDVIRAHGVEDAGQGKSGRRSDRLDRSGEA